MSDQNNLNADNCHEGHEYPRDPREEAVRLQNQNRVENNEIGHEETACAGLAGFKSCFEKVTLDPGESKCVGIHIPMDELKYFNDQTMQWRLEKGVYQFTVGNSSKDDRAVTAEIELG